MIQDAIKIAEIHLERFSQSAKDKLAREYPDELDEIL